MSIDFSKDGLVDAVKLVRERTGCDILTAKTVLEQHDINSVDQAIHKLLENEGKSYFNVFWMVFVEGQRGPAYKHFILDEAVAEAKRLISDGGKAFVLRSEKVFEAYVEIKEGICA